ncbi:MAG: hypothetical protein SVC26_07615, partial [Pseudomonadota bacterium]|nr:hypothetical protein [Pseudomonadota bacterium]
SSRGVKKSFSGGMSKDKILAATKLNELIENSKLIKTERDKIGRADIKAIHYYKTDNINIDDRILSGIIFIREHEDGRRYYDHMMLEEKNSPETPRRKSSSYGNRGVTSTHNNSSKDKL